VWAGNSLLMALRMSFALGIRPKRGHSKRLPTEKAPFPTHTDSGSAKKLLVFFPISGKCLRHPTRPEGPRSSTWGICHRLKERLSRRSAFQSLCSHTVRQYLKRFVAVGLK